MLTYKIYLDFFILLGLLSGEVCGDWLCWGRGTCICDMSGDRGSLCWHSVAEGLTRKMEKVEKDFYFEINTWLLLLPMLQNALVTTYDCGDIVTTFLHKETKLTRRKFEWVEHNILAFLVKTFCIPLLWWFKGNVDFPTLDLFVIKSLDTRSIDILDTLMLFR